MAKHKHRPASGGGEVCKTDGLIREFKTDDLGAGFPLLIEPGGGVGRDPMDAGTAAERVTASEGLWNPGQPRYRKAGADRVTGA